MISEIRDWKDINNSFDGLIIGNGGSIVVSEKFKYESLFKFAIDNSLIPQETKNIFA